MTCACQNDSLRSSHFILYKQEKVGNFPVGGSQTRGIPILPVHVYRRFSAKLSVGQVNCLNWIDGAL